LNIEPVATTVFLKHEHWGASLLVKLSVGEFDSIDVLVSWRQIN